MAKIEGHDCFGHASYAAIRDCPFYSTHLRNQAKKEALGRWLREQQALAATACSAGDTGCGETPCICRREAVEAHEVDDEPYLTPYAMPGRMPTAGELMVFLMIVAIAIVIGFRQVKAGDAAADAYARQHSAVSGGVR